MASKKRSRADRRRRSGVISDASQLAALDNGIDVVDNELMTALDLEAPTFLARGHRGVVYVGRKRGQMGSMVAIKRSRNPNPNKENEATWLARCNEFGVGPRLLRTCLNDAFAMEYVDGQLIGEFLEHTDDCSLARSVVANLLEQCRRLDRAGIEKSEMLRLNRHVIVSRSSNAISVFCTMLDFERCSFSPRPRNVTQLCQYLSSSWVAIQLARLNINVDVMRLRHSAALYKKDPGEKTLRAVAADLGLLSKASCEERAGYGFGS